MWQFLKTWYHRLASPKWFYHTSGRWLPYLALAAIAVVYGYLLQVYAIYPAERLHLVEYGFVGFFLFRALRFDMGRLNAYIAALVLTAVIGFVDESIQWVLPQRYFEMKDVQLNAISGALGLLVVYFLRADEVSAERNVGLNG